MLHKKRLTIDQSKPFIEKLESSKYDRTKLELIVKEMHWLNFRARTKSSMRKYLTIYRNLFKKKYDKDSKLLNVLLRYFRVNNEHQYIFESDQMKLNDTKKIREIKDVDKIISTGIELLKSESIGRKIVGLVLLTGRRPYEIGCEGIFKRSYNVSHIIEFKKEGSKKIMVPVLHDQSEIVEALNHIRTTRPEWINERVKFAITMNSNSNKLLKKIFKDLIEGDVSQTDLRYVYAEICYKKFNFREIKEKFFLKTLKLKKPRKHMFEDHLKFQIKK
jgi:hypothetical protein